MTLTGLHLFLTYQCNYECDHCFVWGSPSQRGTMTLHQLREIYDQAGELGSIEWIYLEGGEPFLYYPILVWAAREAARLGFRVGIVSNNYWATGVDDAVEWLRPLVNVVQDLSISTDLFHDDEVMGRQQRNAMAAAQRLGIPIEAMVCELPTGNSTTRARGARAPVEGGPIGFRGRAAVKLAAEARKHPWRGFDECPHEKLDSPSRVHLDPLGHLHLCQGLTMGNLFERPLTEIVRTYAPREHPIVGPLLAGGPAALVQEHGLAHEEQYADACHLCYEARVMLRERFPEWLAPGQVYGDLAHLR